MAPFDIVVTAAPLDDKNSAWGGERVDDVEATERLDAMWQSRRQRRLQIPEDAKQTQADSGPMMVAVLSQSTTASPMMSRMPSKMDTDGDDELSLWTAEDSLNISEDSEVEEVGGKPPAMLEHEDLYPPRSPFDGEWLLCNDNGGHSKWLRCLTIHDTEVLDGDGVMCTLRFDRRGPTLFGGVLKRKGAALVRIGRTGSVQVYLRRESEQSNL